MVFAAGFGESAAGAPLEAALREAAQRYSLPVCGPNCDGLIALHSRAALWGDALAAPEPGHVALVSQSGNLVVNALATRRGLRLHTAVSCGNEAVVTTPDWVEHLAREPEVRSIALLVENDGDGARLCEALAVCAEEGVGVAVLKVGASARGRGGGGRAHRRAWPATTASSARWSRRRAPRGRRTCTTCWSWRRRSAVPRRAAARRRAGDPDVLGRRLGGWAPTRPPRSGLELPPLAAPDGGARFASGCRMPRRWPTRSTTRR